MHLFPRRSVSLPFFLDHIYILCIFVACTMTFLFFVYMACCNGLGVYALSLIFNLSFLFGIPIFSLSLLLYCFLSVLYAGLDLQAFVFELY